MKNFLPLLCSTSLFNGLTPEELQTLLAQLGAVMRSYGKGEALVLAGEPNRRVSYCPVSWKPTVPGRRVRAFPSLTWNRAACSAMC